MIKSPTMQLTTYDNYKDSGIEWLGSVPEHWSINRLKSFCSKITDGAHTSPDLSSADFYFLSVVNLKNGVLNFKNALKTSKTDYEKLVRNGCRPEKGDVLFSKDGTIGETVEIKESIEFVVGSSFIILRPIAKQINSTFFRYLLSSHANKIQARLFVRGAGLPRISIFNTAKLFCSIAPLVEQTTISNYLDQQTTRIDKKIDLLTQKIKHYQDLKTALINKAVTKGLDDTVEMKDSGVEWIGEIPKHWNVKRIKDISNFQFSNVDKKSYEGQKDVVLCNYTDVYKNDFITAEMPFMKATANKNEIKRFQIQNGDVIFTKDSETFDDIANPALVKIGEKEVVCGYHLALMRPNTNFMIGDFLFRLFQSRDYNITFSMIAKGVTRVGLGLQNCKNSKIVVPPKSEQQKIVNYLNQKTSTIEKIITNLQTQIEQQKDLRKTLINDVVTGKLRINNEK